MPQCVKCKEFFPPNYTFPLENPEENPDGPQKCVFCDNETDVVELEDGTKFSKKDCIAEYKELLARLAKSARQKGVKEVVKNIIKP
jgi:hypothetical protein